MTRSPTAERFAAGVRVAACLVALGALTAAVAGCGDVSKALPDVQLPSLDGDGADLDIEALTGPAVVNVWATWCQPCVTELPEFQAVSEEFPGIRFIGVDASGSDDDQESIRFLADLGVTYEQLTDRNGELSAGLEITELPATVVVDASGEVALIHQGRLTRDELIRELVDL